MKTTKFFALLLSTAFFISCSNDDDSTSNEVPLGDYENGILVLNEGNFGVDNSTISYLSNDFATFQADAYLAVNGESVGNTGQSIGFYNELAFVVVNGSNKIEILNRYTLEKITSITTGLSNPRFITFANGKGYVTNWGDGGSATDDYVAIVNLTNYTVENTISVVEGPEQILTANGKLYVAHKGGYNHGNQISVINLTTNSVDSSIMVGDVPGSMEMANGNLYVLCSGKPSWTGDETIGKFVTIDLSDNSTTELDFGATNHPSNLDIENNVVYFTMGSSVYKMNLDATVLPSSSFIDLTTQGTSYDYAYGFAVKNDEIFVGDAKDFSSNGFVYIYSTSGSLINEFEVKTSPNGFYFNN